MRGDALSRPAAVDVVIPVFNGAATIESALASIQAQSVRDIRMIVVNDGSTDASGSIVERMAAADGRILLVNRENGGIVDALNDGLGRCTAEIVARHDADDLALPDRFEKQLAWLRDHAECIAVAGAIIHIDERGRELGPTMRFDPPEIADPLRYPQKEPYLMHPFLMMRRAAAVAVGGYRYVYHSEDTDLYWRLQEVGGLANMDDLLGYYRVHAGSVTGSSAANGRISAMSSQLSGLSALRRRSGRPDIAFPREAIAAYKRADTVHELLELGVRGLDADEAARLRGCVAAKLLEVSAYRPYELDSVDCGFIRAEMARIMPVLPPVDHALIVRQLSGTAARLLAQGHVADALRLCPPQYLPLAAARLGLRLALPASVRGAIRRLAGRGAFAK